MVKELSTFNQHSREALGWVLKNMSDTVELEEINGIQLHCNTSYHSLLYRREEEAWN